MPYTDAAKEATKRYQAKLKPISIRVQPEEHEHYKNAADHFGLPLRQFVLQAMDEYIENHSI